MGNLGNIGTAVDWPLVAETFLLALARWVPAFGVGLIVVLTVIVSRLSASIEWRKFVEKNGDEMTRELLREKDAEIAGLRAERKELLGHIKKLEAGQRAVHEMLIKADRSMQDPEFEWVERAERQGKGA